MESVQDIVIGTNIPTKTQLDKNSSLREWLFVWLSAG